MVIAIDFDHTLMDTDHPVPGRRMGPPTQGAVETMKGWKREGHTLIIYTVRGDKPGHVEEWLRFYGIPFDVVTATKVNYDVLIDDRCMRFEGDWDDIMRRIYDFQ